MKMILFVVILLFLVISVQKAEVLNLKTSQNNDRLNGKTGAKAGHTIRAGSGDNRVLGFMQTSARMKVSMQDQECKKTMTSRTLMRNVSC